MQSLKTNARVGNGEFVVVEADEYDRSFLALSPTVAIITSLEADHLDCYKDIEDLKNTFVEYANKTPFYGTIICCLDELGVRSILPRLNKDCITYGFDLSAQYRAEDLIFENQKSIFNVLNKEELMGTITLNIPGIHNVKNALAAISLGLELKIPFNRIKMALEKFKGVERRFDIKAEINNIIIVDDYAHHPTEVEATIRAAKSGWNKRLVSIFQPHLYSRTRDFYKEFAKSLKQSDLVFVTDVYPAREKPIAGINGEIICQALKDLNHMNVFYVEEKSEISKEVIKKIEPNDMIITIGAGDIWKSGIEIIEKLRN